MKNADRRWNWLNAGSANHHQQVSLGRKSVIGVTCRSVQPPKGFCSERINRLPHGGNGVEISVVQRFLDFLVALLNRIQFWAVRWKIDEPEAFPIPSQECPEEWAFVPRPTIQKHH